MCSGYKLNVNGIYCTFLMVYFELNMPSKGESFIGNQGDQDHLD